ncbi:MipA/OmpV family protein [Azonexus sp.]|jgi:outer membrane scaffolding protein for murein synthesis (MipA/OmpV family)|uniref:MipA/OmpV family protein n=1 Tax=Azonexus sp. TaxID=1872668 RepID=UPI002819294E|nr:MipA/OmpV family protein [Azonexus sp.]MDR1995390.1 MipA/OmpV family protein [Azonexus sp.]
MAYLRLLATLTALLPALAFAEGEGKPLWEAGVGVTALSFPSYRGSDHQSHYLLPIPYFVYRGDFLKADRHGVRGNFFESDRVDFKLSFSASPPTRSKDAPIRDGMPELRSTIEVGPELDFTLWRSANRNRSLKLRLPVRTAFTVERSPRSAGWVFSPNLNLDIGDLPGMPGWNLGFVAGPYFATRRQHEYFYGVSAEYATATRPAYEAKGGYSGSAFLVSLSKRYDKTWVGFFARYDALAHTAFADSPLVRQKHSAAAGIAVSWVLGESSTRVGAND